MKSIIICLILFIQILSCSAQDLGFNVHGAYSNPVKKDIFYTATSMADIIPDYPASWIMRYDSLEIVVARNGKVLKAKSTNELLSLEQKQLLSSLSLGNDISINIDYQYKNILTDNTEIGTMNYSATVIPEIEAEYIGGETALKEYLKENAINKIPVIDPKQPIEATIKFTINEEGKAMNAYIMKLSEDPKTDKLLLNAINKMPKWRPAENSKGIRVKQDFVFIVSNRGGC